LSQAEFLSIVRWRAFLHCVLNLVIFFVVRAVGAIIFYFSVTAQQIQKKTWIAERAGFRRYD
jgi:hypothetical protein